MRIVTGRTPRLVITLLTSTLPWIWPSSASDIVTNWVAFNDHRPGPLIQVGSNPPPPTATSWGTSVRATIYDMRVGPGGNLTNFQTGAQLPVTLAVTPTGSPDDFGECSEPDTNTPAFYLFHGIVDVGNPNSVIGVRFSSATATLLTFSGLDPSRHYVFRGTSLRRGGYALRWTVATLIGAQGWVDAHINGNGGPGVITSNNFPADLGPGQAAYDSGDNKEGAVVGWDFISPAEDGTFSVQSSNYVGHIPGGLVADNTRYGYAISSFLLAEVEAARPAIVTQPPAETTVEQNRPFSLSVTASGSPLLYQWYQEGVGQIAGATFPTYSVSRAALGDTGNYYVRVYNPLGSVTSALAHVTVNADVTPPSVVSAFCFPSFDLATRDATIDQVIIEYNEAVDPKTSTETGNYSLSGGASLASVNLTNERTVLLKLSAPLAEDTDYTVTVSGVQDLVGNTIGGGPNNPATFHTWVRSPANGLLFEAFNTGPGVTLDLLTNSPLYPNNPYLRTNLWAFDTRVVYPDNSQGGYGARTHGVFIPPVSGNWVFFLRAWDRGAVYLNPSGLTASGEQFVLAEVTGNNPRDWNKFISAPFALQAGHAYYIEALNKADSGTGTDVIKVAARLEGTGFPTLGVADTDVDTNALLGAEIGFPLAPRDLGGALTIVQDVADASVEENHPVTFSLQVSNPSGLPLTYQWRRDGVDIPGANGPSYSLLPTLADNGAVFSVRAAKIGSAVTSRDATLSVVQDITPPQVIAVHGSYLLYQVIVSFSERMRSDPGSTIPDPANFQIDDGSGSSVQTAVVDATGTNIILTVDPPLSPGEVHSLQIDATPDVANNPNVLTNLPLLAFVFSQGFLQFDYFGGLSTTDNSLDSTLLADPRYPSRPDQRFFMTAFDSRTVFPDDSHEGYGAHVTGLFTPSVSGNYIFYLRSDDSSRLYLNPTGQDPAGAVLIDEETTCCRAFSALPSAPQALTAGQSYYVAALLKEGTGGDYVQVAAKLDTDPTDPDTLSPIPGARLRGLADPVGASLTVTQQPQSYLVTRVPATNTFDVGARSTLGGLPNTSAIAYQWQRDDGAGFVDIAGATTSALTLIIGTQDKSANFRCLVFSPGAAAAISDVATLTVPSLSIRQDGSKITVFWPLAIRTAGFELETKSDLSVVSWDPVPTGSYETNGNVVSIQVSLPPPAPSAFYRLRQP